MSWSLGEARALCIKAAKGTGFSWGLAEETGAAVQWLHASNAPGVEALAQYLDWRADNIKLLCHGASRFSENHNESKAYCPIELGCAIQDLGFAGIDQLGNIIGKVCQPLLLVPFISRAHNSPITIKWENAAISAHSGGMQSVSNKVDLVCEQSICTAKIDSQKIHIDRQTRVPSEDQASIDRLNYYAGKTYAPATEASRLAGAGAGLTDND